MTPIIGFSSHCGSISGAKFVSKPGNVQQIVCDPDGHSLQINASANSGVTLR